MRRLRAALSFIAASALATACAASGSASHSLAGEWDAYVANGSTPLPGFEGWRRLGFAHFAQGDSGVAGAIRRRTGETMLDVTDVVTRGDSMTLNGARGQSIAAAWHGDTLAG